MKIHYEREIKVPRFMDRKPLVKVDQPRSSGYHLSAINRRLGIAAGKLTDSDGESFPFERETEQHIPLMWFLGQVWEEGRASMYDCDSLIWQPDELERDGIYGTPDGLVHAGCTVPGIDEQNVSTVWETEPRTWECKRTTKKLQSIGEQWMYLKQALGYAALGMPRFCQFDVLYVDGNYKRPYQPVAVSSLVEFSDSEVQAWWKIIVKSKEGSKQE